MTSRLASVPWAELVSFKHIYSIQTGRTINTKVFEGYGVHHLKPLHLI